VADWLPRDQYRAHRQARAVAILSVDEARKRTGFEPEQLACFAAEELVRKYADGRRESAVWLPAEFVPGNAAR
jgi:hypothetical protein